MPRGGQQHHFIFNELNCGWNALFDICWSSRDLFSYGINTENNENFKVPAINVNYMIVMIKKNVVIFPTYTIFLFLIFR